MAGKPVSAYFTFPWGGSSSVGHAEGHPCNHSGLGALVSTPETSGLNANASQVTRVISVTADPEMDEPEDEMSPAVCGSGWVE